MPLPGKTSKMDVDSDEEALGVDQLSLSAGKSSAIHDSFGVVGSSSAAQDGESEEAPPARSKRKRDAGGASSNKQARGKGKKAGGASAARDAEADGFGFEVDTKKHGSFAHDASAAKSNGVHTPPGAKQDGNAYVGNVITVARGKDKKPADVARQYQAEAFDDPAQAASRFALVVGVNYMESVLSPQQTQTADLDAAVNGVSTFQAFPLTAFRRQWRPTWKHTSGANKDREASIDTVRAAAAAHSAEAREQEQIAKTTLAPVGPMRTATTQQPATQQYLQGLSARYNSTYVHIGDADAVNLKAPPVGPNGDRGLFDRYDDAIARAKGPNNAKNPQLISGGYLFRVDNKYLGPDEQHADPHAGLAGKVAPQTAESAQLDMGVRQGLAKVSPASVYLPEPNLLIRGDVAKHANFGKKNNDESKHLAVSLARQDDKRFKSDTKVPEAWAEDNIALDTDAALYTDGGRFDKEMAFDGEAVNDYGRGKTDIAGLTHPTRNPQSVARSRVLGNAIAHMSGNMAAILSAMLPQRLLGFEQDDEDKKKKKKPEDLLAHERQAQQRLASARAQLAQFEGIALNIQNAITSLIENDAIPPLPEKENTRQQGRESEDAKKLAKAEAATRHKTAMAAHKTAMHTQRELGMDHANTNALVTGNAMTPQALSALLVRAASSAKNFDADKLPRVLNMCREAATATAQFLATYYPQEAMLANATAAAQLPPVASSSTASAPSPNAMQVDPQ